MADIAEGLRGKIILSRINAGNLIDGWLRGVTNCTKTLTFNQQKNWVELRIRQIGPKVAPDEPWQVNTLVVVVCSNFGYHLLLCM